MDISKRGGGEGTRKYDKEVYSIDPSPMVLLPLLN